MRWLLIFDGHKTIEIKIYENNALSPVSVSSDRKMTIISQNINPILEIYLIVLESISSKQQNLSEKNKIYPDRENVYYKREKNKQIPPG